MHVARPTRRWVLLLLLLVLVLVVVMVVLVVVVVVVVVTILCCEQPSERLISVYWRHRSPKKKVSAPLDVLQA